MSISKCQEKVDDLEDQLAQAERVISENQEKYSHSAN